MIVIVDGIDRSGKTTLCNILAKDFGYKKLEIDNKFAYDNQPHNVDVNSAIIAMLKIIDRQAENIVIDRFIVTELVYGIIDRKDDEAKALSIFKEQKEHLEEMDNVVMVNVMPYDIKRSIALHGSDLTTHKAMIDYAFDMYGGKKIACTMKDFDEAIKQINR